jgi:hypothetical protein
MRCVRCGWPSKNYEMLNDGRPVLAAQRRLPARSAAACAIALIVIVVPPSDRYELVAHGADGATYDLGSWRLAPGRKVIFTSGTALTGTQIKNLQITQPNGPAILALRGGAPPRLRIASQASGPQPGPGICGPEFAAGRDGPGESGKVAGVVDAMDSGKSAAVPLDLVNARGTEI